MTRTIPTILAALAVAGLALCACTSTGKLASKTNGPVDLAVTVTAVVNHSCEGLRGMDAVYIGAKAVNPPPAWLTPDRIKLGDGAEKTLNDYCGSKPVVDPLDALSRLAVALVDLGNLAGMAGQ